MKTATISLILGLVVNGPAVAQNTGYSGAKITDINAFLELKPALKTVLANRGQISGNIPVTCNNNNGTVYAIVSRKGGAIQGVVCVPNYWSGKVNSFVVGEILNFFLDGGKVTVAMNTTY